MTEAYPLHEMGIILADEREILWEWGLEDVRKSGCFMCPYQPPSWFWALSVLDPDLFAEVVEYERVSLERNAKIFITGRMPIEEVVRRWRDKNPQASVSEVLDKTYER